MDQVKKVWMLSLKVGDTVCDCRYQHLKIVSVQDETAVVYPAWLRSIVFYSRFPLFLFDWLDRAYCFLARKFNWVEVYDRTLTMEDGSQCSTMHCCDSADHSYDEHDEEPSRSALDIY